MLLKSTLVQVERECRMAKHQVSDLQRKLHALETELEHVKLASGKSKPPSPSHNFYNCFPQQHPTQPMEEASSHQCKTDVECGHQNSPITGLQTKLFELEKKYEMQVLRHEQLTRDMTQLRQEAATNSTMTNASSGVHHSILCDHHGQRSYLSSPGCLSSVANDNSDFSLAAPNRDLKNYVCQLTRSTLGASVIKQSTSFQVFVAKYNYDPVQHSPNENPEAELTLKSGDYIFIYGDIDEDGFYDGELMNGKRGLVPSNFIEKVPERDLEDYPVNAVDPGSIDSVNNASYSCSSSATDGVGCHNFPEPHNKSVTDADDDLEDILEVDEDVSCSPDKKMNKSVIVVLEQPDPTVADFPFPVDLVVERQLLNSLLIAWSHPPSHPHPPPNPLHPPPPPSSSASFPVQSYSIYVDGLLKATVKAKDRTKALIEKVDLSRSHQVSVRAITSHGQSKDQQCIITVGKGVTAMPSDFQVTNITSTSAVLSWIPSNSNWEHLLLINNRNRTIVKPGGYRCVISGLACDTRHSVSIQPRIEMDRNLLELAKVSVNFKTLPSEIPDAPGDIQVEVGPKQGTLLVMWLPVKPDGKPPNSALTGYSVYVDGKRVKDLPSPTGDHVLLESEDFSTVENPHQITIRSTTAAKESHDSSPVFLTPQLLSEVKETAIIDAVCPASSSSSSRSTQAVEPLPSSTLAMVVEEEEVIVGSEKTMGLLLPSRPTQTPATPQCSNSAQQQRTGAVAMTTACTDNKRAIVRDSCRVSAVVGAGLVESGFSAQQLSPLEMKFHADELAAGGFGEYDTMSANASAKTRPIITQTTQSTGMTPAAYGTLPLIEVTKDNNNGSFSDSSFDVDIEEPMMEHRKDVNSPNNAHSNTIAHHQSTSTNFTQNSAAPSGRKTDHRQRVVNCGVSSSSSSRRDHSLAEECGDVYNQVDAGTKRSDSNRVSSRVSNNDVRGGKTVNSKARIFIALFNYDPATMSPNPDGIDEELPFKEGQLIKIIRDKDSDGFYVGEAGGLRGLVPSNMISEVDDPSVATHMLQDPPPPAANRSFIGTGAGSADAAQSDSQPRTIAPSGKHRHSKQAVNKTQTHTESPVDALSTANPPHSPAHPPPPPRPMLALYGYDAQHVSTSGSNKVEQLSCKAGDVVLVYGEPDKNGFLYTERNGRHGVIPSQCLRDLSPTKPTTTTTCTTDRRSRHASGPANHEADDLTLGQTVVHDKKVTKSHKHRTRDDQTIDRKTTEMRAEPNAVEARNPIRQHDQQMYVTNNSETSIHRHHRQ